jgi:beta-phosphoglucomutase
MRYQAVIFDLDGVICHTDEYHYMAWKEIAGELEIPFSRATNDRMRGIDRMASLDVLLEGSDRVFSAETKENYANKKNLIYRNLLNNLSPKNLDEDVKEALAAVRSAGLKLAIGSSSKNTKFILQRLGLGTYFDAVADGTDVAHAKPNPEVFLIAAQRMAVEPGACLVVEDAISGILAAKAAGMDAAVIGGARESGLAKYKLNRLTDLLDIIEMENKENSDVKS